MTAYKKGDRVKVVIEGVVHRDQEGRDLTIGSGRYGAGTGASHVVDTQAADITIEKLRDPLPTTPGSVIRHRTLGYYRMLDENGEWFGRTPSPSPEYMIASNYEVIDDAGKRW